MSIPLARSHIKPLKLLAGAAAASLIIGGAVGAGAQTPAPPDAGADACACDR